MGAQLQRTGGNRIQTAGLLAHQPVTNGKPARIDGNDVAQFGAIAAIGEFVTFELEGDRDTRQEARWDCGIDAQVTTPR